MEVKHVQRLISERLNEIKSDERLSYPTATVFENAPLALIQLGLESRINELEVLRKSIEEFEAGEDK